MFTLAFYVSGHGLGHATRDTGVIKALTAARHDLRVVVRTGAPAWAFGDVAGERVQIEAIETDTGVTQIDSLRPDVDDTARRAAAFYATFDRRVADEAAFLARIDAAAVIGDIPPLAFATAAAAGRPSIAIGNFTWDWIYAAYPGFDAAAPGVLGAIRAAYASTTHTLRLPLHGGFDAMRSGLEDIPFVARRSALGRQAARKALGLSDGRLVVLASFGGHGLDLPYGEVAQADAFSLLTADHGGAAGIRYEDLVAAADVVVSKPGYGIVSECLAHETALLYTSRGRFAEYEVFVAEMPRILRCRRISQEDLRAGRWTGALRALVAQPPPPERPAIDGAQVAARRIGQWIASTHQE